MRAQTPASLRSPACYSEFSWSFNFRLFQQYRLITASEIVNAESTFSPTVDVGLATCADPTIVTRIECYEILRYTGLMRPYAIS
jgi:hypothetical protein